MNIITNKTKITKKDMFKFLNNAGLQNLWLVGICAVIISLLGFTVKNGILVYENFFYLIAGVFVIGFYFFYVYLTFRKQTKDFKDIENEYIFNDDSFIVVGSTNGVAEKFEMQYHALFKVKETKNSIYLFINNFSALIVSKNSDCFSHGDVERLKKFLELKLTPKQNQLKKTNISK